MGGNVKPRHLFFILFCMVVVGEDIIDPILVISIPDFMTSSWLGGIGNSLHRSAPNTLPENGIHAPPDPLGPTRDPWVMGS